MQLSLVTLPHAHIHMQQDDAAFAHEILNLSLPQLQIFIFFAFFEAILLCNYIVYPISSLK